jgi:hypothetical protein
VVALAAAALDQLLPVATLSVLVRGEAEPGRLAVGVEENGYLLPVAFMNVPEVVEGVEEPVLNRVAVARAIPGR